MRTAFRNPVILLFGLILIVGMACGLPTSQTPAPGSTDIPVELTSEPELPITGDEAPAPTATLSANAPGSLPEKRSSHAGDYDSSTSAEAKQAAGGDRFSFGRYERPFNANTMDVYFPYLDIVDTTAYEDGKFVYGVLVLKETAEGGGLPGNYAFEVDLDNDGRGDWLILVKAPASTTWTTAGVQVWNDTDGDVGGLVTISADKSLASGNGYDRLVTDSGQGEIPEAGFARIDPNSPNTIQFAISAQVLGGDKSYMAGMWAGSAALDPAKFDFNDRMTHEEAGAADPDLANFYPIKGLAELDNSCRMAIGFAATGKEPGLCPELNPNPEPTPKPTKTPEPPPPPTGCISPPAEVAACVQRQGTWNYDTCTCRDIIIN